MVANSRNGRSAPNSKTHDAGPGTDVTQVLVVGQVPPPYLGQPIMLQMLLDSPIDNVKLLHARMLLSADAHEVGRFRWGKVAGLLPIVFRIVWARLVHGVRILYYPPSGPNRVTMFRDFAILLPTRWMFRKTIFHFHASGLSELYARLPGWQRWLFRLAYYNADAGVRLSEFTPDDARQLAVKREYVIANGIQDPCPDFDANASVESISAERPLRLLFVAALKESKGLLVLIEACGRLREQGMAFQLEVMGQFESPEFAARVHARVAELNLADQVRFLGVLTGAEKFAAYARADAFCLPTFYECEAFPVVLLEAMAYGLPVVSTRWRGIPSIVDTGETGFLVEPHSSAAVADKLAELAGDPQLRRRMRLAARRKFLNELVWSCHVKRMREMFLEVAGKPVATDETADRERYAPAEEHAERLEAIS